VGEGPAGVSAGELALLHLQERWGHAVVAEWHCIRRRILGSSRERCALERPVSAPTHTNGGIRTPGDVYRRFQLARVLHRAL